MKILSWSYIGFVNFPGVVSFYKDFLESFNEFLHGNASITGMAAWSLNDSMSFDWFFCFLMVFD